MYLMITTKPCQMMRHIASQYNIFIMYTYIHTYNTRDCCAKKADIWLMSTTEILFYFSSILFSSILKIITLNYCKIDEFQTNALRSKDLINFELHLIYIEWASRDTCFIAKSYFSFVYFCLSRCQAYKNKRIKIQTFIPWIYWRFFQLTLKIFIFHIFTKTIAAIQLGL